MTDNIISRLRTVASQHPNRVEEAACLESEAADEIERLRAIERQANHLLSWRYQHAVIVDPPEATCTVRDLHPSVYNQMDPAEQRLWEMLYYPGGKP